MDYRLKIGETILPVQCDAPEEGCFTATIDGNAVQVVARRISSHQMQLILDGKAVTVYMNGDADATELLANGRRCTVGDADLLVQRSVGARSAASGPTDVAPPMPAVVMTILVTEGDRVEQSQPVIVVAAMKMETTLSAPYAGVVSKIHVNEGDKVAAKQILMDIEKSGEEERRNTSP